MSVVTRISQWQQRLTPVRVFAAATAGLMLLGAVVVAPKLTVGAIGGVVFVALALRFPAYAMGIWLIGFLSPYHPLGGLIQKAGFAVMAVSVLWHCMRTPMEIQLRVHRARLAIALLATLILWQTLSIFWSQAPASSMAALPKWLLTAFVFVCVILFCVTRRDVAAVCVGWLVGSAFAAATAVPELLTPMDAADELTSGAGRVAGAAGDPNILAAGLIASLAISGGLWQFAERRLQLWVLTPLMLFYGLVIIATGSRGGLISLAVTVIVALFAFRWQARTIVAVTLPAAMVTMTYFVTQPLALSRLTNFSDGGSGRKELWQVAWHIWREHFFLGIGLDAYRPMASQYLLQTGYLRDSAPIVRHLMVHNTLLQNAVETGIVGVSIFAMIVAAVVVSAWRASGMLRYNDIRLSVLTRSLNVGLVSLMCAGMFISMGNEYRLWALLGLAYSCCLIAERTRTQSPDARQPLSLPAPQRTP